MDYSASKLLEIVSSNKITIGENYLVDVTYLKDPHNFYVRPAEYYEYIPAISGHGEPMQLSDIEIGINIVYESKLSIFIRGMIIGINDALPEPSYSIYASDYGFEEDNISLEKIRRSLCDLPIPALAIRCKLADCRPNGDSWSQESIDAMKHYVGEDYLKMIVQGQTPDSLIVQLLNSGPDIATLMALTGYSTMGFAQPSISRFPEHSHKQLFFKYDNPNVGDKIEVRLQAGKNLDSFYVATLDNYAKYLKFSNEISVIAESANPIAVDLLVDNLPVVVKQGHSEKYERAIVMDVTVPGRKVLVQYVDWGDKRKVNVNQIKPIPPSSLEYPVIAFKCKCEDKQVQNHALRRLLHHTKSFEVIIKKVDKKLRYNEVLIVK